MFHEIIKQFTLVIWIERCYATLENAILKQQQPAQKYAFYSAAACLLYEELTITQQYRTHRHESSWKYNSSKLHIGI